MFNTPIYQMKYNDLSNTYFIKRDDLLPISFGGNKARKASLFFEDIMEKDSDCVVTYGSSRSNHCRIVANIAASKKIPCYIISPIELNYSTFNSKMVELFGASVTQCPVSQVSITIERKLDELIQKGFNPYFIPGGGHGDLGTQAYVKAYEEILDFEKASGLHFDYIFHTSGTGTTQAGLVCGKELNGDNREIVGISNARKNPYGGKVVYDSVNSYFASIGKEKTTVKEISFIDDYILDGYGSFNEQIKQTVQQILIQDGVPLDLTYTGKGFWGMKEYIKKKRILGKKVLFIHTGGTPLFFDNLEELKNEK
jgi:D-cysteine desulfhydrase